MARPRARPPPSAILALDGGAAPALPIALLPLEPAPPPSPPLGDQRGRSLVEPVELDDDLWISFDREAPAALPAEECAFVACGCKGLGRAAPATLDRTISAQVIGWGVQRYVAAVSDPHVESFWCRRWNGCLDGYLYYRFTYEEYLTSGVEIEFGPCPLCAPEAEMRPWVGRTLVERLRALVRRGRR